MNKTPCILLTLALPFFCFAAESENTVADAGNHTCPVSGKPVDGVTTHIHNGTQYNLCSKECIASLSDEPEKHTGDKKQQE